MTTMDETYQNTLAPKYLFGARAGRRSYLAWLHRFIKLWSQRYVDRLAYRNMLDLDESILRDIGVTREDVIRASKLPLSRNAAEELHRIALGNRGVF